MSDFKIHTLGCGSAKPTPRHQPSSTVIDYRGNLFMVDCGEGAQLAFMRNRLKFNRLGHLFLTHLHGDHVFGLPGLVGTLGLHGAGGSLTIHTFEEGRRILSTIFDYFSRDLPFEVNFNILDPFKEEIAFENKSLTVRTIPLHHRLPAVGYVFEEKPGKRHLNREMCDFHGIPMFQFNNIKDGMDFVKPDGTVIPNAVLTTPADPARSYAHLSDTAWMPDIAGKIGPVNLLFHETTYLDINEVEAAKRGHSTASQAADIALRAGAKTLLTGHYSSRYNDDTAFREEAERYILSHPELLNPTAGSLPKVILNREGLITPI